MAVPAGTKSKIKNGNANFQFLTALTGTIPITISGMHYGWPSPSLPILLSKDSPIPITNDEGSWLAVMPIIGLFLGAPMASTLVNRLGRKKIILLTAPPYFAAWIMLALSESFWGLCIARFLTGVVDGWSFNCIPSYMGEISTPKIRGLIGSSIAVTFVCGILLINVIGSYLSIQNAAFVASGFPVILLVSFIWMPESPYYLLIRENEAGARKSLQTLRGKQDVDDELHPLSAAVKEQMSKPGRFLDLFTVESNRKAILVMMILRAAQPLSGTAAISFYAISIFKEGGDVISPELASSIYFLIQLLVASVCSGIVDKTGRRPLLVVSLSGASLALFIEGVYLYIQTYTDIDVRGFFFVPIVALIGYVIIFTLGGQVIPLIMLGELFPIHLKAYALCCSSLYFCVLTIVVSKFFQITKDSLGMFVPFFAFSACCIVLVILIYLYVPETKGKTLEEIQIYFQGELDVSKKQIQSKKNDDSIV